MAEQVAAHPEPEPPTVVPSTTTALPLTPASLASSVQITAGDPSQTLKPTNLRKRQRSPECTNLSLIKSTGPRTSPAPKSPKFGLSSRYSPAPLTAAAAMADERRQREDKQRDAAQQQTPNPARAALGALLGDQGDGMSRPQDAPSAATTMSEPMATAAKSITIPDKTQSDNSMQTSPLSTSSFSTLDSTAVATATANSTTVASPGQIGGDIAHKEAETPRDNGNRGDGPEPEDGHSNKAFTFPGPLLSTQGSSEARRGMSLPHSGFGQESPRSASTKKHKCPYCSTDFTRHHNLKSHLLTHSHEKPYMCQTCEARFRRLHDLKRHTKLHTGERPHVCPKCNRSFARGDALARHNKGQGGCAGRRSSMGSFGGDDQYGERSQGGRGRDDSMDGMMYTGEASHEPERMDEDDDDDDEAADDRRKSLPSIRKHDAPTDPHRQQRPEAQSAYQPRQPSTYPPVAARQSTTGGLYPPNAGYGGGSGSTSPSTQTGHYAGGSASTFQVGGQNIFSSGGMTESPKPLSPAGATSHQPGHPDSAIHRNRSPSLTTQFQQERYGRRANTRNTPPPMGLPPPLSASGHSNAPKLPSLPGLTPPDPRFTLHSQATGPTHVIPSGQASLPGPSHAPGAGTPSSYHSQQGNLSSNSNSHSSHGTHGHASGEGPNNPYTQGTDRLWAYVQSLEAKVNRLQEEVASLRNQLSAGPPHR
ncbi:hypothetical protein MMC08_001304 [Hypocenomyce scalaris]|nr:hypothetical protein [Hypocenomyce scalaris]